MRASAAVVAALLAGASCSSGTEPPETLGRSQAAIENGTPATAYPEAVVVTSGLLIPCSGVLLAPRVVLSAGHCRASTRMYSVSAPNAGNQTATGSADWSTFGGSAATSSDTLLIFLDQPIELATYPTIPEAPVAAGTSVVDIGRTLNGTITTSVYVSPPVTIQGPGDPLGFPYNYEALPDISQDGDSGGPIELASVTPHVVVAIVDTDTVEQNVTEATPIDLFARLDIVRAEILAQMATHASDGGVDASSSRDAMVEAGFGSDGGADAASLTDAKPEVGSHGEDAGNPAAHHDGGTARPAGGGSCSFARGHDANAWWLGPLLALAPSARRRRPGSARR